jgi:hypothetical protein
MSLVDGPEDNLVRAVVRALVIYFHPEFRQKEAAKAPFQPKPHLDDLAEGDMRWRLPTRHSTNSDDAAHPPVDVQSYRLGAPSKPDKG